MDRQLYRLILKELKCTKTHLPTRATYTDQQIVAVYYYAVLNNRSVSWACVRSHWWVNLLAGVIKSLPSQSQMSRRLRTESVRKLLDQIERLIQFLRHRRGLSHNTKFLPLELMKNLFESNYLGVFVVHHF